MIFGGGHGESWFKEWGTGLEKERDNARGVGVGGEAQRRIEVAINEMMTNLETKGSESYTKRRLQLTCLRFVSVSLGYVVARSNSPSLLSCKMPLGQNLYKKK